MEPPSGGSGTQVFLEQCVTEDEVEFVQKNGRRIIKRHPECLRAGVPPSKVRYWIDYYFSNPRRFKDENYKRFEQLDAQPKKVIDKMLADSPAVNKAGEVFPEEKWGLEFAKEKGAIEENALQTRLLEEFATVAGQVDSVSAEQKTALRLLWRLVSRRHEDGTVLKALERAVMSYEINMNALTEALNGIRGHRKKLSSYHVGIALDKLLAKISARKGKAGARRKKAKKRRNNREEA